MKIWEVPPQKKSKKKKKKEIFKLRSFAHEVKMVDFWLQNLSHFASKLTNAKVIYPLFIQWRSLNKKGIDYFSFISYKQLCFVWPKAEMFIHTLMPQKRIPAIKFIDEVIFLRAI